MLTAKSTRVHQQQARSGGNFGGTRAPRRSSQKPNQLLTGAFGASSGHQEFFIFQ
jgi:hypothetical protein